MDEKTSGRLPGEFSQDFARRLNGLIGEANVKLTGQQIARALNRNDGYVSLRRNGKRAWTIDDVDVIAALLDRDGVEILALIAERMEVEQAGALVSDMAEERRRRRNPSEFASTVDLSAEPSAAEPERRDDGSQGDEE